MRTPLPASARLVGFTVVVVAVFAATFGLARALGDGRLADRSTGDGHAGHGDQGAHGGHGGHGEEAGGTDAHGSAEAATTPGLALAEAGYRFVPETTTLPSGRSIPFRFSINGPGGHPVERYQQLHERELHLIVVRRDLTGFQHVHPTRGPDGTWSIDLDLPEGGTWRAFADFAPTGGPAQLTLGVDLQVPGAFTPGSVPTAAAPLDPSLGVSFDRRDDEVEISVRRDGTLLEPEPYLGARGHLVALRAGDLAYLHVHPVEGPGPSVRFMTELPTPGTYALFFDYQVGGVVHTATTTVEVPHGPGH